jgi:hypothetical protein
MSSRTAFGILASQDAWSDEGGREGRWTRVAVHAGEPSREVSGGLVGYLPLVVLPSSVVVFCRALQPWVFLWALAISVYLGFKWLTWWRARTSGTHPGWRSVVYLLFWPGMNARSFLHETRRPRHPRLREWLWALLKCCLGGILLWVVARTLPSERPLLQGWTGMLGAILLLHFGSFHILALVCRVRGIYAPAIMASPLRAQSLGEFWGKRWNLGFRDLAHDFMFRPANKCVSAGAASLLVFGISGVIHDLVISLPARGGYGLPTFYFLLQGLGVVVERSRIGKQVGLGGGIRGRLFLGLVAGVPVFWLFHPVFVMRVMVPFMQAIRAL